MGNELVVIKKVDGPYIEHAGKNVVFSREFIQSVDPQYFYIDNGEDWTTFVLRGTNKTVKYSVVGRDPVNYDYICELLED